MTNAGHPPPLLLPDGAVRVLRTPPDVLVGIDPTQPRREHTTDLPVGSTLVLYTDGLIEHRSTGQDIDEGTTALARTLPGLQHLPADAILDRVLDPVRHACEDDIAALAIRLEGWFRRAGAGSLTSTVPHVAQRWLDEEQQRIWRTWLSVAELLPRVLDAQLQRDAGLSHAAYVVLAMLSEAPGRSRRMSDLARRANQSQSRLSHTVARLEERGWVRREPSPEDGRGNVAVLTDAGWEVVRSVAPGHAEAVRSALFDPLTDEQTRALGNALQAVLDRLDPDHSLRLREGADAG